MYQRATLPNGLRILTERMEHLRSVSIACFFGVGSRYETAELAGVSHFIEHMLFKGSRNYPTAQAISETIEGVGGALDASTDKEMTIYSAKVSSRHFDLAFNLLGDMIRHPLLDPAELEKERRVIIEEIGMYRDSPQEWVGVLADEVVWPNNQPLGREIAGTRATVEGISRDAMRAYLDAHYTPGNLVISVVGDITHDQVLAAATRLFGDWPAREAKGWAPCPIPTGVPRVRLETRKTEQTNLVLLTPGLSHSDPDYYALTLLNAILGSGMSSRLFQEVRERQGLAYDVSSGPTHYHDTGIFGVYAGVEPKRTPAALRAILAELARLRNELPAPSELARAREYVKGALALGLESPGSVAGWLGGQEILLGEIRQLDDVMARIDAVTLDDVQRLARMLFVEERLRLAVIGPQKSADELDALLHLG